MKGGPTPPLPAWADRLVLPLLNLILAFLVSGAVIALIGENPVTAMRVLIQGAFVYPESLGYTLYYTTNFLFTGLAVATAFHAALFNIGGEGQAAIAGLFAALAALFLAGFLPMILALPLAVLAAAFGGGFWAYIPGLLQAKRGSHIVITTIMFNFIATAILVGVLSGALKEPGQQSPQTPLFPESAHLGKAESIYNFFGIETSGTPLNAAFLIGLICLVLFYILIWKTRIGYDIRTVGSNVHAARYAGINVARTIIIAMIISGAFAGMMAVNEVLGVHQKLLLNFTAGYGFTGIAVALMGRNHPIGIFFAALLFGALFQGGAELDFEFRSITREMVLLIQGLIILFSGALAFMLQKPLERAFALLLRQKRGGV